MADTLAQLIRSKYPGAYDDLSDTELESAILAKHAEYGDLPRTQSNDRGTSAEQLSAIRGFVGSAAEALAAPLKFAASAITDPAGTYEGLVDASARNFTEAKRLYDKGEYGHAAHHAIAGVVPPYGVVTEAGDRMREGDIAGALGEAVGTGLTPRVSGAVVRIAKNPAPVLRVANRAATAAADFAENNPGVTAGLGAAVGYAHGGPLGVIEGAVGGGTMGRLLRMVDRVKSGTEPAPAVETGRAPISPAEQSGGPSTAPISIQDQLIAELARREGLPFKVTKADVDRITALDRELGSQQTARALRHDPRFAGLSAADRQNAIRTISQEQAGALPQRAQRVFDETWDGLKTRADQIAYIAEQTNPAVKAYLSSKPLKGR
jgi:ElaB/YqjD/DUF883 family membrane-anchored ribosome-binding protein